MHVYIRYQGNRSGAEETARTVNQNGVLQKLSSGGAQHVYMNISKEEEEKKRMLICRLLNLF
jgi:hypothetical protein